MIIIYVHLDVLDDFAKDVKEIYTKEKIRDYKISIRPKRNHIGVGIDYDEYVAIKDKTLTNI